MVWSSRTLDREHFCPGCHFDLPPCPLQHPTRGTHWKVNRLPEAHCNKMGKQEKDLEKVKSIDHLAIYTVKFNPIDIAYMRTCFSIIYIYIYIVYIVYIYILNLYNLDEVVSKLDQ